MDSFLRILSRQPQIPHELMIRRFLVLTASSRTSASDAFRVRALTTRDGTVRRHRTGSTGDFCMAASLTRILRDERAFGRVPAQFLMRALVSRMNCSHTGWLLPFHTLARNSSARDSDQPRCFIAYSA